MPEISLGHRKPPIMSPLWESQALCFFVVFNFRFLCLNIFYYFKLKIEKENKVVKYFFLLS